MTRLPTRTTPHPHPRPTACSGPDGPAARPAHAGAWRLVDEGLLWAALAALDAVIDCEPFADVSPPGTEGFLVYAEVAAAREWVARALGQEG